MIDTSALVLSGAREAGCFREVAALHSDHLRQVPLYYNHSFTARAIFARLEWLLLTTGVCSICLTTKGIPLLTV